MQAPQIDAREEMRLRIAAIRKQRGQDKEASPITAGELGTARSVLAEFGAGDIFVVPETWDLSGGNPAICLTDASQVTTYSELLNRDRGKYADDAKPALPQEFKVLDILVKQSVVGLDPIKRGGVIWHELGHTTMGAAENGNVFELECLLERFPKPDVKAYVLDFRGIGYFAANAVDPGLDRLMATLDSIGIDLLRAKKKLEADALAAKRSKIKKRFRLTGQLAEFQGRAGASEPVPDGVAAMDPGATFAWTGVTWEVQPRVRDFVLEVVSSPLTEALPKGKQIQGTLQQLRGRAGARDNPVGLDGRASGEEFDWDGSRWRLVSATTVHEILVIATD